MAVPAWLVSMVVHIGLVLALAFLTFRLTPPYDPEAVFVVNPTDEPLEVEELKLEEMTVDNHDVTAAAAELPDPALSAEFEPATPDTLEVDVDITGDVDNVFGDLSALLEVDSGGAGKDVMGIGKAVFFGVETTGTRFVYVVDNSNSMNGGKFESAVHELIKSVGGLDEYNEFYVIFYSDMAYPLFYPQGARGMVKATPENKQKLVSWLSTVERCLQTRGEDAMKAAFVLQPDVIYLLGDGSFTDKAVEKTLATSVPDVTIHTLGFGMNAKAREGFENIARRFGGKFHEIAISPAAKKLSETLKRPKNNSPHGAWGLALGQRKPGGGNQKAGGGKKRGGGKKAGNR